MKILKNNCILVQQYSYKGLFRHRFVPYPFSENFVREKFKDIYSIGVWKVKKE